jgi:hypothetical protein
MVAVIGLGRIPRAKGSVVERKRERERKREKEREKERERERERERESKRERKRERERERKKERGGRDFSRKAGSSTYRREAADRTSLNYQRVAAIVLPDGQFFDSRYLPVLSVSSHKRFSSVFSFAIWQPCQGKRNLPPTVGARNKLSLFAAFKKG